MSSAPPRIIGQYLVSAAALATLTQVCITLPAGTSPRNIASPAAASVKESGSKSFARSSLASGSSINVRGYLYDLITTLARLIVLAKCCRKCYDSDYKCGRSYPRRPRNFRRQPCLERHPRRGGLTAGTN